MRRLFLMALTALAVVALPQIVTAEEPKKGPEHPGPGRLFQRLDANHDGQITADEVPQGAPERLKAMLKRADKNGDKKLTREEVQAAIERVREMIRQRRPGPLDAGRPGPGRGDGPPHAGPGPHRPFGPLHAGPGPHRPFGPPHAGPGPRRPFGPPHAGPGPRHPFGPPHGRSRFTLPDPKVVFAHLDRDHDTKLSLEEFVAGMRRFHSLAHRPGGPLAQARRPGPGRGHKGGPPYGHKAGPPQVHKARPPHGEKGGPPYGHKAGPPQVHKAGPPQVHKARPSHGEKGGPPHGHKAGPPQGQKAGPPHGHQPHPVKQLEIKGPEPKTP